MGESKQSFCALIARYTLIAFVTAAISGCGGSGGSTAANGIVGIPSQIDGLTISGTPATTAIAGTAYSFTPSASGPNGNTLTFSVTNKPLWASFSISSGELSGTPTSAGTYSGIVISGSDGASSAALPAFGITAAAAPTSPTAGGPIVLYTDIASGPNSGGENNAGAYLSIFGKNFGTSLAAVHVFIGGVEVTNYRYLGPSLGRTDIEQISAQIGSLGNPALGKALPVKVVVSGVSSNTDQSFTVNPGRMLFVDYKKGNDSTALPGDMSHPYRHVQTPDTSQAAYGAMQPGDIIVMRAGTWTDLGDGSYFVKFIDNVGTAPTGASGTGPLTIMAYPTETVSISMTHSLGASGGISGVDARSFAGGKWVTLADLHIESGGDAGVVNVQIASDHWRTVNNEITAATATNSALAGGITGNGTNAFWVGNHIHNIAGASNQEMHGIYVDGDGSYEVAYNLIESVSGGNGFQIYVDGSNGSTVANNVNLHHNMIHDISKHGINIADNAQNNIKIWDNIVYNIAYAGLRLNSVILSDCKIYNNTFYNTNTNNVPSYGAITNDAALPGLALDLENNIFWPAPGFAYIGGVEGLRGAVGTVTNNLYYGGSGSGFGAHQLAANPEFANVHADDFHLTAPSPAVAAGSNVVSNLVVTDYDLNSAPQPSGGAYDIGAYELIH
jgi:hypothetical protein